MEETLQWLAEQQKESQKTLQAFQQSHHLEKHSFIREQARVQQQLLQGELVQLALNPVLLRIHSDWHLSCIKALKKGRFWITPDPYHKDDNIQIGREVKISCQVEAVPSEELTFSWFKNGRPLRSSERMVITQTDPDVSPGTTNLDIIDLKFTDFGTYTCVASLKGGGISDISIDVNISSSTVPPNLTVPQEKSPLVTREGDIIELQCQVTGKPKPIILWSRADKEIAMPDGSMQMESYDGILRIVNVSREMTGTYRCQTSQYNGFNVKPREALVQLIVQCSTEKGESLV
ncbi:MAM domain-containing glycosylphosphatidylinositol anchor protein 2 [Chelonia mydas]|uniref:MAM domain-containing glycosylphosphatidylinositol anchor protein 2 n=1 Tax=Chelonia mydas TaxID=8469 RepID=M7ARI3_CHEMY|nr:MAM domain-containing glycosylphosphatidylinositol anchor protein 2 [Chelonia mydas]